MKQDPLVAVGQVEQVAHLRRVESLEVPKGDHLPLDRGQLRDLRVDDRAGLARQQPLLGLALPRARRRAPGAVGPEAIRVNGGLAVLALERGERDTARLALAARLGAVPEAPDDPG